MKQAKILRISGIHYLSCIDTVYKKNSLKYQSYKKQQNVLFQNSYIYSDSFSRNMNKLGHRAYEILHDVETLQKTWAQENNCKYTSNWQTEILLKQIQTIKPDIIYFQDIHSLSYEIRKNLKNLFPFIKLIIIFRGYPGGDLQTLAKELSIADILLVGSPILYSKLKKSGLNPYLIYHSFDEKILENVTNTYKDLYLPKYDFTFLGSSGYGHSDTHLQRYLNLINILKNTNMQAWVDEGNLKLLSKTHLKHFLKRYLLQQSDKFLSKLIAFNLPKKIHNLTQEVMLQKKVFKNTLFFPLQKLFPDKCHPPLYGLEMFKVFSQSKITFNQHCLAAQNTVDNIRMFQATGMKTCLLTDFGSNLSDIFEPDSEIITYKSIDECIEKVKFLLLNEKARKEIALKGQQRTLKDHTTYNRCLQIDDIIQKHYI